MALAPGTTLGPYTIVGPIGAGGMGEVYRARDARLQRDVAIKVLPPTLATDPERLRRFEQEARATGQLNHPNIVVVFDIGRHGEAPYVVEELLEGDTLRGRLAGGALPPRKAIDYARQVAMGLAAAHQRGIVHRDLKPENLFVTSDGRVKILDFGLAKLLRPEAGGDLPPGAITSAPTAAGTDAGVVLGTVGYMSPEQVRGQPTDHRSDLFAFGSILYEMLAGRRAFTAPSSVEAMNAILKEDPPDLTRSVADLPPGLARIVEHCLEKSPDERFQSARDLGFQLEALSAMSAATSSASGATVAIGAGVGAAAGAARGGLLGARILLWPAVAVAAALAAAGWWMGRATREPASEAAYSQLTYRSGNVSAARFTPDGETVVYSAAWDGMPNEIFTARTGSPESRPLGLEGAELLSVSKSGELAILRDSRFIIGWMRRGTLARVPLSGGVPRDVMQDVEDADWAPDGEGLAVVRSTAQHYRLEYPPGKVLYETGTWLNSPRFSRDGRRIAFMDHPSMGDDRGRVGVVDLEGNVRFLTEPFSSARGIAWTPSDDAIWFSAGQVGNVLAIYAVDLEGRTRVVDGAPASMTLADLSSTGRALVTRNSARRGIIGTSPGDPAERDLSWLDWSRPGALSYDGRQVLFEEQGQGGGEGYSVYLRPTDGAPAVRLGRGSALDLSRDGRWALVAYVGVADTIGILPTGAGEARTLKLPGFEIVNAIFHPDDRQLVVLATEKGRGPRLYLVDLEGSGTPRPLTPEGIGFASALSQDGRRVAAAPRDAAAQLWQLDGSNPVPLAGSEPGDLPVQWSQDDRSVFVAVCRGPRCRVDVIDVATGRRDHFRDFEPADRAGLLDIGFLLLSPDQRAYVYSYRRILSVLYQVEGLR